MRKSLTLLIWGGLLITILGYAACPKSPEQLQSYAAFLQRQELKNDPAHAGELDKALVEMSTGEVGALQQNIKAGLSPDAAVKTTTGPVSLLTAAVAMCREDIAQRLVELGASPNGDGDADHGSPLNVAAAFGEATLVDFLIKHGADVDQPDIMGDTPLASAVEQHQAAAASVLLKDGANPDRLVRLGATATDVAMVLKASHNPSDQIIAEQLMAYGARKESK